MQTNLYTVGAKIQRKKNLLLGIKCCPSASHLPPLHAFISSLNYTARVLAHNFNMLSVCNYSSLLTNGFKHRRKLYSLTVWSWSYYSFVLCPFIKNFCKFFYGGEGKKVLFYSDPMSKLKFLPFGMKEISSGTLGSHTKN